ncbi:MAG TPA: NUDIX hydrolase [Thermobifida alba]|nr:NUDIX hydrolase [Thermobifida alba]
MTGLLPAEQWFASLPTSYLAASGLITDPDGRVLLVDPNYREHWTMPGGVVEHGEAPHLACEREVAEEVGLAVRSGRLLAVHWSAPRPPRPRAFLSFVFDCGTVAADTPIRLQEEELDGYVFAEPARALRLMDPALAPRLEAALRARDRGQTVYVAS